MVFPNPFIGHFSLVFCLSQISLSLTRFSFTRGILTLIFSFFVLFDLICLEIVFPIQLYSVLGLAFCLVYENSLNCTSGLVLLCLFISTVMIFVATIRRHNHFKSAFCSFIHAILTRVRV